MNKPAALMGDYIDAKFMRGLKVTRVSIDIPIEESQAFFKAFGTPNGADPVKVVIARLATPSAEQSTGPQGPATQDDSGPTTDALRESSDPPGSPLKPTGEGQDKPRHFRDMPRSQQAAIKCQDENFQGWLRNRFYTAWRNVPLNDDHPDNAANEVLKAALAIGSKKELDTPGPKADAWDKLLASYDFRDQGR